MRRGAPWVPPASRPRGTSRARSRAAPRCRPQQPPANTGAAGVVAWTPACTPSFPPSSHLHARGRRGRLPLQAVPQRRAVRPHVERRPQPEALPDDLAQEDLVGNGGAG